MAITRPIPVGSAGRVSSWQAVLEEVAVAEVPFTVHCAVPLGGTVTLNAFDTVPLEKVAVWPPLRLAGVIELADPMG